jgi:hypothetical protein
MAEISYNIQELMKLQRLASSRSQYEGTLVISKNNLLSYLNTLCTHRINIALLNQAIRLYCTRGYKVDLVLGSKKYNLIAEKVPAFLDWFFSEYNKAPEDFVELLLNHYKKWSKDGKRFKAKDESYQKIEISILDIAKV